MDFSQLMKVAARNNDHLQRKLDERRKQQAESTTIKKKKCPTFSADAVKAHLPKRPDLPPVVLPVKKRGGRKEGDIKSSDNRKNGVKMPAEKQQAEGKWTKKGTLDKREQRTKEPLSKREQRTKKKSPDKREQDCCFRGGNATVNTKERKPMGFKELMSLAKEQKNDGKTKEGERMKPVKETGRQCEQLPSTSKIKRDHSKPQRHTNEGLQEKRMHKGKSLSSEFKGKPVKIQCAKTMDKPTVERTESTRSKCIVSSRTIDTSQLAGHNQRREKRPRDTGSEETNAKRLHVNPYLRLDDFPVRKTDREHTHSMKKKLRLEYEEMDFIDDDSAEDFDISSHIKEIFGYDRQTYAFENPATDDMESTYRDIMKEERVSSRLGLLEDLEEERKEKEWMAKHKK